MNPPPSTRDGRGAEKLHVYRFLGSVAPKLLPPPCHWEFKDKTRLESPTWTTHPAVLSHEPVPDVASRDSALRQRLGGILVPVNGNSI